MALGLTSDIATSEPIGRIVLDRAKLEELVALFYDRLEDLGEFAAVSADAMPQDYRRLLAHDEHMTVTVESHHGGPVDVRVLAEHVTGDRYARKIVLTRKPGGPAVLFGIARIDLAQVGEAAKAEILSREKPLGRVLIDHDVLREVKLNELWTVTPGAELRGLFGLGAVSTPIYGRTALIYCNEEPAVELLEIVAV